MKHTLTALLVLFLLSACANLKKPTGTPSNEPYIFSALGYAPIESQSGASYEIKILNAIKASKIEAYKEMAEQIYGVLLTSKNQTEDTSLRGDQINAQVAGLVRGAKVLRSYHEGGVYVTELELDMKVLSFLNKSGLTTHSNATIRVQQSVYY